MSKNKEIRNRNNAFGPSKTKQLKPEYFFLAAIVGLTMLAYSGSLKNGFLAWDDLDFVVNNVYIQHLSFENLGRFFTSAQNYMYTPLMQVSFAIDYLMGGANPAMFHFTNLFLHVCNVVLVFYFVRLLTGRKDLSLFTALFFAISPMNVDTVAWISTRGNLLFTMFYLLSLMGHLVYTKTRQMKYLVGSLVAFVFSCFSKSMAVTLPVVLLILDYYFTRKITLKNVWQKIPFFVFAIVFGLVSMYFRSDAEAAVLPAHYTIFDRIFMFTWSVMVFLLKLIVPYNLSAIGDYPLKMNGFLPIIYYFSPFMLAAIIFLIYRFFKNNLIIFIALAFFLVSLSLNLLPLLEDSYLANRYAYLPSIGLGLAIAFLITEYTKTSFYLKSRTIMLSVGVIIVITFSFLTWQRTQVWESTLTVFDDIIKKNPNNIFAHNSRGIAKYEIQDFTGSIADYSKAIEINPAYHAAYFNRAISFYETSQIESSLNDYNKAIELNPNFAKAFNGKALLYMENLNDLPQAVNDFTKAITLNPEFAQAYYNRGIAYAKMNDFEKACPDWKKVHALGFGQADEFLAKYCSLPGN